MTLPIISSQYLNDQPPQPKLFVGSSSAPPGACSTPSSVTKVVVIIFRMGLSLALNFFNDSASPQLDLAPSCGLNKRCAQGAWQFTTIAITTTIRTVDRKIEAEKRWSSLHLR